MNATNRLDQQRPAKPSPPDALDPHDMTPAQRLDWIIDKVARLEARCTALENGQSFLRGASDLQGKHVEGMRAEIAALTRGPVALPRTGR